MKRTLLLISAITVFAALGSAQDDAAYAGWMKTLQPNVGAARAAITAKDNAAVAAAANKLADTFDQILNYWTAKKVDDAVTFSKTARDAAKTLAAAHDSGTVRGMPYSPPRGLGR
jgi:hypothetical protein